jgi:acetylornithine deacetylase/succinyl-diaminopimelate desuccinylase family protein
LSKRLKEWRITHDVLPVSEGKHPRFCILGGIGEGQEGLHFHGHYDVVPAHADAQFDPQVRNERLYGRGSSDMKSGLVAILYMLRYFQNYPIELNGRISFSFVPDEESGSLLGTQHLLQSGLLLRPSLGMLMPEPTSGVVWYANKGALTYRVEIGGKPAHVALEHQGENAFESMTGVVQSLLELKKAINKRKTTFPVNPTEANRSVMLIGGEAGSGINFNVVPDRAFFTVDRRFNPEEELQNTKQELMQIFDAAKRQGIRIKTDLLQEGESSQADPRSSLAVALRDTVGEVTGTCPPFELCPGLCEIRFFNRLGIPAYAYGPGILEISHGPNEYVSIPDVLSCTEVFIRVCLRLLG